MAMNVNFLKGLYSKYEGLASKDSNTFYLTYESGTNEAMGGAIRLFLGAEELTNKVDIAALREYIGTLPEGATSEDIVSYISEAITAKIGTLKIGDTSYDTVVEYVIAKTTGIATDSVVQAKADKIAPAKAGNIATLTADGNLADGGKTIAEAEANAVSTANAYTDAEIQKLDANVSSTAPEAGKGVQVTVVEVDGKLTSVAVSGNYDETYDAKGSASDALDAAKGYTDEEITGLEFALSEDGKTLELKNKAGTAVATLDTTDFVVDGMLSSVVADQENNKLTFTWNTDGGVQETVVELSSIADIYTGSTGEHITVAVSNENVISATLSDAVKQAIAKANSAMQNLGDYIENSASGVNIVTMGPTDSKTQFKMGPMGGSVTLKSGLGDILLVTGEGKTVKVNGEALGNLATKDEADLNLGQYAKTADISADIAKGVAAKEVTDTLKSAAFAETTAFDAAGTAAGLVGVSASVENGPTGVYAAIQGATTNTVKDCVDSINAVTTQLTWGSF